MTKAFGYLFDVMWCCSAASPINRAPASCHSVAGSSRLLFVEQQLWWTLLSHNQSKTFHTQHRLIQLIFFP